MSKIGKKAILIPEKVEIKWEKPWVRVKGPKGESSLKIVEPNLDLELTGKELKVKLLNPSPESDSFFGAYRSLISNMVIGVSQGFEKRLELVGVGYKAELKGKTLMLSLGFSAPVEYQIPPDLQVSVDKGVIAIKGMDKQRVGQIASEIRALRPPEPYKGKGIRYQGEQVRRKAGKVAVGATTGGTKG